MSPVYSSLIEAHADVGWRTEIINFVGLDLVEQTTKSGCVCQVSVMKMERNVSLVRIRVDVVQTIGIEGGRPANDAMHLVAFGEQELGQVRTVLPRDSGNEGLRRSLSREPWSLELLESGFCLAC